jgi:hypothetical protein
MFILNCPECEAELDATDSGYRECRECGITYLARFGHVIRIDLTDPQSDHAATPP